MGNFSNLAITEKGRNLLADVQAGGELDATRLVMGSGDIPAGKTSATMTDVVYPVINIAISSKEKTPDGKVIFGGYYSNTAVTEDFRFKEFAMYARAIYRDDAGAIIRTSDEVLYSYGNAGSSADLIPAYTTGAAVEKQLEMVSYVGNETNVNLTVESGIYVGMREFEVHASRHFADGEDPITPADIGAAPSGFGLGTNLTSIDDANAISATGFYYASVNVPEGAERCYILHQQMDSNNATQIAITHTSPRQGLIAYRNRYNGTWSVWKWFNPPMKSGEAYLTAERLGDKFVHKRYNNGVVEYRLDGESEWKSYANLVGAALADHAHDGRYYTETEANRLLAEKAPFPTWGEEDIEAGSPSNSPAGASYFVLEPLG